MGMSWKYGALVMLGLAVAAAAFAAAGRSQTAADGGARGGAAVVGPRYSVIDTEAHNLIVTDNKTNTLYFYTIDPDEKVGADLKLRGTIDLNQVGKAVIRPNKAKAGR